jgi:O-antigen ligase
MIWIEIGPEKELGNHLFPLVEFPVLGLVLCLNLLFRYMLRPLFVLSVVYCPWCGSSWQSYIVLVLTCGLKLAGILHLPAKILGVLFFFLLLGPAFSLVVCPCLSKEGRNQSGLRCI